MAILCFAFEELSNYLPKEHTILQPFQQFMRVLISSPTLAIIFFIYWAFYLGKQLLLFQTAVPAYLCVTLSF